MAKNNSLSFEQLVSILEQSADATAIYTTQELIIEFASSAMLAFWGKGKDIIGLPLEEGVPELKGQPFKGMLQRVLETGVTDEGVIPAETRIEGCLQTRHYAYQYRAIVDEDGHPAYILHTASDVTARIEGEQALEKANQQSDALMREQQANEELAASNEELAATNEELLQTQEQLADLNTELEDRVQSRTNALAESQQELQAINEELSSINEELSATNEELTESQARLEGLLIELASSEQKVRSIVASAPFPIGVYIGREMRIELANQSIIDVWGKGNDVIGRTYHEVLPELAHSGIYQQLDGVYTTGKPFHARNQRVDLVVGGLLQPFYFNYSFTPLYDQADQIYGVMNTAAEVTDVVVAKQKVEQSERNLENLIMQSPVAMCMMSGPEHVITIANPLMIELWGKTADSVMNKPVFEALPDARGQGLEKILSDVFEKGENFRATELPVDLIRNGMPDTVYQNFVYEPYKNEQGAVEGIIAVTIDVTAQVMARRRIEENEKIFQFLLNAMPQQVWTAKPDGKYDYVNDKITAELGEPPENVTGNGWQSFVHPEDLAGTLSKWQLASRSKREFKAEFRIKMADGKYCWYLSRAVPMIEEGKITLWLGTNTNIDEQKSNERKKDEFISIASHELKTPLTTIKAFFQLTRREIEKQARLSPFLGKAERQMDRLGRLIEDLLDVSKINAGKMVYNQDVFDVDQFLVETVESVQQTSSSHHIELKAHCGVQLRGDQHRLEQVLVNLLNNAIKYSPDGDLVLVNCEQEGQNLIFSVQDFGIGIAPEHLNGLFDRFYRVDNSSARFQGLGLGLFISNEIVKRHGGSFWIETEPGKGSTFFFLLPLSGQQEFSDISTDGETFYEGSFIRIHYRAEHHYLEVDWLGYQNYDSVVKGCGIMMDLLKKNNCHWVLNDNTLVKGNWSEASDWGAEVWFPAMAEAGLKKFAWIYSPSMFSRIAANRSLPSEYDAVQVAFFDDKAEAKGWLVK